MLRQCFQIAILSACALPVLAGNLYRFNVDGQVVIKDSVPAELAPLGYEVLNSQGMVVRRVERELTAEEIAARDAKQAAADARKARIEAQREQDKSLLRLYATPADVDRAHRRKVDEVQAQIDMQQRRIADLETKLASAQQTAADAERRGYEVQPNLLKEIELYQQGIDTATTNIAEREEQLQVLNKKYSDIRQRVRILSVYSPGTLAEDVDEKRLK